jgi:hypothetical protein
MSTEDNIGIATVRREFTDALAEVLAENAVCPGIAVRGRHANGGLWAARRDLADDRPLGGADHRRLFLGRRAGAAVIGKVRSVIANEARLPLKSAVTPRRSRIGAITDAHAINNLACVVACLFREQA